MKSIILDPEIPLTYMQYDHIVLGDLRDYVRRQEEDTHHTDPQERVKLIVRYSLGVVTQRIAEARKQFHAAHPGAMGFCFEDEHLDEEILVRYFLGHMTRREMRDVEAQGRWCPECGWQLIGVGRAVVGYGLLFGIHRLLNPVAVRTLHLSGVEIDEWLERRRSREDRRDILGHLKICRRCRGWVKREVWRQNLQKEKTLPSSKSGS